ncbi:Aldehyde/histidinol dehydrogenase [Aspergillus karnatakaensis]|uniref:NAD-dependent succinate-semialdehyde dehydrogenase n=1 Tax=Aspergillus karnatakaensis TaxID=1810916 RepID=UPI003CCD760B
MSNTPPFTLNDPSLLHDASLLNGKWVQSQSGKRFEVEDPGTGVAFTTVPTNTSSDVDSYIQSSHASFLTYRHTNPRTRAKLLLRWHNLISSSKTDIATLVTYETGKPLTEALGEVDYALGFSWWFAGEAERIRGSVAQPSVDNRRTFVIKQPIGVCVALVPWNFPVAMVIRKIAAALAAGCTIVIKPSPETPLSVLALADLVLRAGFPAGVVNIITTDNKHTPAVSELLCKHPLVRKVSFTGSTQIGELIARHCSVGLKKVTLELGGNCPFIIFDDADLDDALAALMVLKWRTAGQACTHANRVYVQRKVYERFLGMTVDATKKIKVGHGAAPGVTMGALTTGRGIEKLESHVKDALDKGGDVVLGGKRAVGDGLNGGNFFEPTIISGMTEDMLTTKEEIFGPLLGLYRFDTEEEVVRMANDTSMGLASYFFTKDASRTWRLLESLEAGMIGMNTGNSSAAESPFGGIKASGYGKEAGKDVAIEGYLVAKTGTLTVAPAPAESRL